MVKIKTGFSASVKCQDHAVTGLSQAEWILMLTDCTIKYIHDLVLVHTFTLLAGYQVCKRITTSKYVTMNRR